MRFSQVFAGKRVTEGLDLESQAGAGNGEDPVNVLNPLQAKHVQNPLRLETPPQMVNSTAQSASEGSGTSIFAETTAPSTNRDRTVRRSSIQPGIRQTSPTRGPASNVDP